MEPPTLQPVFKKNPKSTGDGNKDSDGTNPNEDDSDRTQVDDRLMETVASFLTMLQSSSELQ